MMDVINRLVNRDNASEGDYVEAGILMCGKCHAPKQKNQTFPKKDGTKIERIVPISCRCELESEALAQTEKESLEFRTWMRELQGQFNITDSTYHRFTFLKDDRRNEKVSNTCRRYVDHWDAIKQDNMGVLFYGSVGTGKSFYACAIVNALLEQNIPATVTNFPRLLNILQGTRERQSCIDHLQSYQLLVIDDLGVERDSSYAAEQIFNVIDARARAELPLIVTTNLTLEEMENPPTMQLGRIYDRILEMTPIRIKMVGESRRTGNAKQRTELARKLLSEDKA